MSDEKLVLVTGASGYLASHVVRVLQEAGYRVRGTVRSLKNERKIKHLRSICPGAKYELELVEADLMSDDGWDKAVEGCTYVHHVASPLPASSPSNQDEVIKPAVDGTLRVLKACVAAKTVKRVVLTGAGLSIMTTGGNKEPYTEKDWADPDYPNNSFYTKSKIYAEKAAWEFVKDLPDDDKFEMAVTHPVMIVGPALHNTPSTSCDLIGQILGHKRSMIPKFFIPVVDVRDCAQAHLKCMLLPEAAGNRHILISKTMSLKEMGVILDKEFRPQGYNCTTKEMPNPLLSIVCCFNKDLRAIRTFAQEPVTMDNHRMVNVLGITPTDTEKSFVDMGYSLIENGFVKKTSNYKARES